jgi:hypothetical protein
MSKIKTAILGGLILGAAATLILQHRENVRLREQLRSAPASVVVSLDEPGPSPAANAASASTKAALAVTQPSAPSFNDVMSQARNQIVGRTTLRDRDYQRLLETLRQIPVDKIPDALNTAGQLPGADARRWLTEALLKVWAEKDGGAAIAWSMKNLPADAQRRRLPEMLSDWAAQNPNAALTWLREFNASQDYGSSMPPGFRQALFEQFAEGMAEHDYDGALALWSGLTNDG